MTHTHRLPRVFHRTAVGGLRNAFLPSQSLCILGVAGVAALLGGGSLQAASYTWAVPNSGYWEWIGSWGGSFPTLADDVSVINPGGASNSLIVAPPSPSPGSWTGTGFSQSVTLNSTTSFRVNVEVYSALFSSGDVTINNRAGALVSGGSWSTFGAMNLTGVESTLVVTNGGRLASDIAMVGNGVGATGTATVMNGGSWFNDGDLRVGANGGSGLLQIASSGSIRTDGGVVIGFGSATSQGTVAIFGTGGSQGILSTYSVVKSVGSGTLVFDGGILQARKNEANFISGFSTGEVGIGDNGAYIDSNGFNIGVTSSIFGQGSLVKLGSGTLTLSGSNSYGGQSIVRAGTLSVSGGGVINSASGTLAVGASAGENGGLSIGSGGRVTVAQAFVGATATGTGSITISSGTLNVNSSLSVGTNGLGSFTLSGGAASNGNAFFGSASGTGNASVSAGTWTNTSDLLFGRGTLTVTGGTVSTASNSILGAYANTESVASVSGGTWDTGNFLVVGFASSGSLQVNGGLVAARNGTIIGYDTPGTGVVTLSSGTLATTFVLERNAGSGKLNLNGGTLRALASNGDFLSGFEVGDVTVFNAATIDTDAFSVGIGAAIGGTGGLRKTGAGTLTLSGSNAYTGQTSVDGGTLLVTGDSSSSLGVSVSANSTLGGTGTVDDVSVAALGILTAGTVTDAGLFTIKGDLTMNGGSILSLQFSGTGAGAFDQLAVGGLFSATDVTLYLDVNYVAQQGDSFRIFTGATAGIGDFNIVTDLGGGLYWDASQLGSTGVLVVVPEPAATSLAALSLGVLALRRRRRASKSPSKC